ncbi:MAG: ATP-binding protein [Pseudomonadota bacterium]
MRLWPRTLFGRNALLLASATTLAATISGVLLMSFLFDAQVSRAIDLSATLINTMSRTAQKLDPVDRAQLISALAADENLDVRPGLERPALQEGRANTLQMIYVERFAQQLENQDDLEWFIDTDRTLWLRLRFSGDYYWVGARMDTTLSPLDWFVLSVWITIVLITLFALLGSRAIAKPLAQLREATDQLDLESNLKLSRIEGPVEVAALAVSFRRMANRLKRAEDVRAETLAALSHDLRTPLARLRLALEMMEGDDELKESANRQVQDIDTLIGQFMDYARGTAGEEPVSFDIAFAVADIAAQYQISYDGPDALEFVGHHNALRRAVINLIENAEKYGKAPVRVALSQEGADIIIAVRDKGQGFDPQTAKVMVQSFRRGDAEPGVSGSGLGLAIVDQVARAHEGKITFEQESASGFIARLRVRSQVDTSDQMAAD